MVKLSPPGDRPRKGQYAEKPGSYMLAIDSSQPLAYPGEKIILDIFISGYGKILKPKLHLMIPPEICDEENSYFYDGIEIDDKGSLKLGAEKKKLLRTTIIGMSGLMHDSWTEGSPFVDMNGYMANGAPSILTEYALPKPVFEIELKIRKPGFKNQFRGRYKSGEHPVQLIFTYFNGEQWISEKIVHNLVLPSWYQRHALLSWITALLVSIAGVALAVLQLIVALRQLHAT